MKFSDALNLMERGEKVTRRGWNGSNQYVFKVDVNLIIGGHDGSLVNEGLCRHRHIRDIPSCTFKDFFCIKTSKNEIQVGWLASQSDMLAEDWDLASSI